MRVVPGLGLDTTELQKQSQKASMAAEGHIDELASSIPLREATKHMHHAPHSTFLGLPLEIRLLIYENLTTTRISSVLRRESRPLNLDILAVSRQVNAGARPVLYSRFSFCSNNTSCIDPEPWMGKAFISPPLRHYEATVLTKHLCFAILVCSVGSKRGEEVFDPGCLSKAFPNIQTITMIPVFDFDTQFGRLHRTLKLCVHAVEGMVSLQELVVVHEYSPAVLQASTRSWMPQGASWESLQTKWLIEPINNANPYKSPYLPSLISSGIYNTLFRKRFSEKPDALRTTGEELRKP